MVNRTAARKELHLEVRERGNQHGDCQQPATVGHAKIVCRSARQDIFKEGDSVDEFHLLAGGWAGRCKQLAGGQLQVLAILLPGDCLVLPGTVLDHSILAFTAVRVARISPTDSDLPSGFWSPQAQEAAILRQWLTNLGQRDAHQRIAHFLCEIFERARHRGLGDAQGCEFPLTQQDLAHAMGLTPVHVNRMLQHLRHQGLIELGSKRLNIPDRPRLWRVADFDPSYLGFDHDEAS